MSIVRNGSVISEVNINNLNISEIYKGNILVYTSALKVAKVMFRDLDDSGNLTLATGNVAGLFDNIKTISDNGLFYAFNGCTGITGSVSFPSLTSIGSDGLQYAFNRCKGITSIHFRADAKSIIEAQNSYSSKFGADNATIYFDL